MDPPGNSPPDAVDDNVTVAQDSLDNVLDVLINDTDPDPGDTLLIDAATTDTASVQGGTVVINLGTQDRILYTSMPTTYNGPDSFVYGISDGNGGSDTATVNVTVDPVREGAAAAPLYKTGRVLYRWRRRMPTTFTPRSNRTWTVDTSLAGYSRNVGDAGPAGQSAEDHH